MTIVLRMLCDSVISEDDDVIRVRVFVSDLANPLFSLEPSVEVDSVIMLIDQKSLHTILLGSMTCQDMDVEPLLLRLL